MHIIDIERREIIMSQNYGNDYGSGYGSGSSSSFALIVVLFILLIIVGASFMMSKHY